MKRINVIFESSPFDRKGLFNAVHNRILHLKEVAGNMEVEAYCLQCDDSFVARKFRKSAKLKSMPEIVEIDGIKYNMLWYRAGLWDYVRTRHFGCPAFKRHLQELVDRLQPADVFVAHGYDGAVLAQEAARVDGVPYIANWHGSEVHTHPWKNARLMRKTRELMSGAKMNCFVSRSLMATGLEICPEMSAEVLYNGVSEKFLRYDDARRVELREKFGVAEGQKVVAYIGNFYAVKNTLSLPDIFFNAGLKYAAEHREGLVFWVIGDGKERQQVERFMSVPCKFWGNQAAELMPDFMNCVDVLVLPSRNEGLPLVTVEAIKCGANVVGSRVGGIPEVIGEKFTVPFAARATQGYTAFVNEFADKIVSLLESHETQSVPAVFDWHSTACMEFELILRL